MNEIANIVENTTNLTPLEVALQVDENGWTTAKRLYDFLELDPSHYQRWCNDRILNNPYVDSSEYSPLGANTSKKGGKPTTDYAISANLAKMLAVASKSPKGEQVKQYLTQFERASAVTIQKLMTVIQQQAQTITELSNRISLLEQTTETKLISLEAKIASIDSGVQTMDEASAAWATDMYHKVCDLCQYYEKADGSKYTFIEMLSRMIKDVEIRIGTSFSYYVDDYKIRKQVREMPKRLDVIAYNDRLLIAFEAIYKKYAREVGIEVKEDFYF